MISQIEGTLEAVDGGGVHLRVGDGFIYEVLVSTFAAARLAGMIGQRVTLHTLHYMESQNQGATLLPRLAGFLTPEDKRFFELFTTTKGIGNRKALRAITMGTDQIAAAIADRDLPLLQSLPEIGRRTAETIVATLHGKVDRFISAAAFGGAGAVAGGASGGASGGAQGNGKGGQALPPARVLARDTLEVLLQLGENRTQAVAWIDEALRDETLGDPPRDVQELIARVYRVKAR